MVEEGGLRTTAEALQRRFVAWEPMRIAIEVGTRSPWICRLLERCGHEVLVANARKFKLNCGNTHKSDKLDAENLAAWTASTPNCCTHSRTAVSNRRLTLRCAPARGPHRCPYAADKPRSESRQILRNLPAQVLVAEHMPVTLLPALGPLFESIAVLTTRIRSYTGRNCYRLGAL